jgi:hypothetical protein
MTAESHRPPKKRTVVVLIAATLVIPATAKANNPIPSFGFNDDLAAWQGAVGHATALGSNTARVPIAWNADPRMFAGMYRQMGRHRVRPIISLWGPGVGGLVPTARQYAHRAARFARRYPKATIQLLSEPNHCSYGGLTPRRIVSYVVTATHAIRRVRPGEKIIGPAMSPSGLENGYVEAVYSKIPRKLGLGVGLHLYPWVSAEAGLEEAIRHAYGIASRFGPVHVTEVGISEEAAQENRAQLSADAYRLLSNLGARTIIFHRLRPSTSGVNDEWETTNNLAVLNDPVLATALAQIRAWDTERRQ